MNIQVVHPNILFITSTSSTANYISRTVDSGKTWVSYTCPVNSAFLYFTFKDSLYGMIEGSREGDGTVFITSNGGKSWDESTPSTLVSQCPLWPLIWSNDTTAWAMTWAIHYTYLWKSTNSGHDWIMNKNIYDEGLMDFQEIPQTNNLCYIGSGLDYIFLSNNGGNSWSMVNEHQYVSQSLSTVDFCDSLNGIAVGWYGQIFSTHDGGITWDKINGGPYTYWKDCHFVDSNKGIFIGEHKDDEICGMIASTIDAGKNFTFTKYPFVNLEALSFPENDYGYMCGGTGSNLLCYKTTDGGTSWSIPDNQIMDSTITPGTGISFPSLKIGWVTSTKALLSTTDGGSTWRNKTAMLGLSDKHHINKVSFISDLDGFLLIDSGYIFNTVVLSTHNGGRKWDTLIVKNTSINAQHILTGYVITDVIVSKPGSVRIVLSSSTGDPDSLLCSNDKGFTWQSYPLPFAYFYPNIFFADKLNGWTANGNSAIYLTEDGGATWKKFTGYTDAILGNTKLFFLNKYEGWIFGEGGVILHTTNGGINTVRHDAYHTSLSYQLSQNYPNPTSGITNIEYRITNNLQQNVVLIVYDIFGREIATLANEQLEAGNYTKTINTSSLPAGVYYYRLVVGDQVITKKMIVMK